MWWYIVCDTLINTCLQTKLTNLYQSACQQSERKIEEMAEALEQVQTAVEEIEKERDQYRDAMRDLENK